MNVARKSLKDVTDPIPLPSPTRAVAECISDGTSLPVIDVGPFLAGQAGALDQLASDVKVIQEHLGFYSIKNHGVPQAMIDAAVEQTRLLFHMPLTELLKYRASTHVQGFWPSRSTGNPRGEFADEKEKTGSIAGWTFLRERSSDDQEVIAGVLHRTTNKWPDANLLPEFRSTLLRYQQLMLELALKFVRVYARALHLPRDYFESDFRKPEWYARCNYYDGSRNSEGEIAAVAHTDHSFLTLLPMSPVPGLQVRTPAKTWMNVAYIPDAIVVNTGEWLNRISNGLFRATPHRVTEPSEERITLPFFLDPDDDAIDEPVPGTVSESGVPRNKRQTFYEHFVHYVGAYTKA